MHAIQHPHPFQPIPVGFSLTVEEIDLWGDLRKNRQLPHNAMDAWVMGLSDADMLRLVRLRGHEVRYGTCALDNMVDAMALSIACTH